VDKERLKHIPDLPGVYLIKDEAGCIIYIGKAASLKKRVSSYFGAGRNLTRRARQMTRKAADISFFITGSEAEALISEAALIKQHRPRYNVALKDDKSYPYIKLTVNERFPRVFIARRKFPPRRGPSGRAEDGALYYGPYTDVRLLRKALAIMKRIFPLRTCARLPRRPCLNYHMGQCCAPCARPEGRKAYPGIVNELKLFLEGRRKKLIDEISKKMRKEAHKKNYEKAALLRDRIMALSVVPPPAGRKQPKAGPYDEIIALMHLLGIRRPPVRIEAFDVSNISGSEAVGSMISFINGRPSKKDYRKFKIRGVEGIDDYKMMKEIVARRYERVRSRRLPSPDLIIIDGGKGHLNAASSVLDKLGFGRIPAIGIAKRFERIYLRKRSEPVVFSRRSAVLRLVQRLRDEAHRFAVSYHRRLRRGKLTLSALNDIKGLGEKKKRLLLRTFGSVKGIRKASRKRLVSVKGIDNKIAEGIRKKFAAV